MERFPLQLGVVLVLFLFVPELNVLAQKNAIFYNKLVCLGREQLLKLPRKTKIDRLPQ